MTKYLNDHPGGPEIILEFAGKNADEMFEDIGHSNEARSKMKEYFIGKLKVGSVEFSPLLGLTLFSGRS